MMYSDDPNRINPPDWDVDYSEIPSDNTPFKDACIKTIDEDSAYIEDSINDTRAKDEVIGLIDDLFDHLSLSEKRWVAKDLMETVKLLESAGRN